MTETHHDNSLLALRPLVKSRENHSHKGNYGHLLLVCGCDAMPGAAVLATGAALHSGCGLVTLHSTEAARRAAAGLFPSAMLSIDKGETFSSIPENIGKYSVIAAGPGLGQSPQTINALCGLLEAAKATSVPMLLDADALNILSSHPELLQSIPHGSVLTPHEGELRRLVNRNDAESARRGIRDLCKNTGCILIEKGFHTRIHTPQGIFVNETGNPGMAKGGSGDVLTGLVGGLMARGYSASEAARLGVWIHGFAGDCLTEDFTTEAYSSFELIGYLYKGFSRMYGTDSTA